MLAWFGANPEATILALVSGVARDQFASEADYVTFAQYAHTSAMSLVREGRLTRTLKIGRSAEGNPANVWHYSVPSAPLAVIPPTRRDEEVARLKAALAALEADNAALYELLEEVTRPLPEAQAA
jgi:hypothetical protein